MKFLTSTFATTLLFAGFAFAGEFAQKKADDKLKADSKVYFENCSKKAMVVEMDWKSWDGNYTEKYKEGSATLFCLSVVQGMSMGCIADEESKDFVAKKITAVKCVYKNVPHAEGTLTTMTAELKGSVLTAYLHWDNANVESTTASIIRKLK